MMKLFFLILLFIFLSGCFHETSFISRYGQSIVLNPKEAQKNIETISDQELTNPNKPNISLSKKDINYFNKFQNIDFSSSKFLKGNPNCISIIRVKVLGSLSYDELMYELRKRAATMGGNAIGINDLKESLGLYPINLNLMESLILAQNERWRRGLGMQVERDQFVSILRERNLL